MKKREPEKEILSTYAEVTHGRDEPDYMEVYTPYGTVVLTPKVITGTKRAIRYARRMYDATAERFKETK